MQITELSAQRLLTEGRTQDGRLLADVLGAWKLLHPALPESPRASCAVPVSHAILCSARLWRGYALPLKARRPAGALSLRAVVLATRIVSVQLHTASVDLDFGPGYFSRLLMRCVCGHLLCVWWPLGR